MKSQTASHIAIVKFWFFMVMVKKRVSSRVAVISVNLFGKTGGKLVDDLEYTCASKWALVLI